MLSRPIVRFTLAQMVCLVGLTQGAMAADFTNLVDAADDFDDYDASTYKGFDFHLEPSFRMDIGSAEIVREYPCVPTGHESLEDSLVASNPRLQRSSTLCSEPRSIYLKEMEYAESTQALDLTLRAGLYKDLELRLKLPYVFSTSRGLKYAANVTAQNSSVDPATADIKRNAERNFANGSGPAQYSAQLDQFNSFRFFDLPDNGDFATVERSGMADPSLGIHWAPFNDERDDTKATLVLGLDYVLPLGTTSLGANDSVGRGVHEFQWKVAASKRFRWIDPYFGLQYFLPVAGADSPIREVDPNNIGQIFTAPPQRGLITFGTEFIPHEDLAKGARYALDLRLVFGYTSDGRDYNPMFDHIAQSACAGKTAQQVRPQFDAEGNLTNADDVACAWILREPANAQPRPQYDITESLVTENASVYAPSGIMTVEGHGTFGASAGLHMQPSPYFQFRANVGFSHRQQHFITNSRTGKNDPATGDQTVALTGEDAARERNPVYNPSYDSPGSRFRVQGYNTWNILLTTAMQF